MSAKTEKLMNQATLEQKAIALQFLIAVGRVTESQLVAALVIANKTIKLGE